MKNFFPKHLQVGDEVRVVAPSSSLGIIGDEAQEIANKRFFDLGLKLTFGKNVKELDDFNSSSIESRVADLHEAFSDTKVRAVICVIGGFNSNQLLPYIDWALIKSNPKIFIGYSDITVLHNAILTNTGLVTYLGPAYSTFGQKLHFDFTLEYFEKCLMRDKSFTLGVSTKWSDDEWYIDQDKRTLVRNTGPFVVQEGKAQGELVGGNLSSLSLLFGTPHMPSLEDKILCIEDDEEGVYRDIDRQLQSLLQQTGADKIRGILIGRFQNESEMDRAKIKRLIALRPQLKDIPVIADLDFGHTSPLLTFPLGGSVTIDTSKKASVSIDKS